MLVSTLIRFLFILLAIACVSANSFDTLYSFASSSLNTNLVKMQSGKSYMRAGSHVFGGLWTRDFCFSVPALLLQGNTSVVRDHLDLILSNVRSSDFLVARLFDDIPLAERYALSVIHVFPRVKEPLKPYYEGGNAGEHAIDGNALVIIATLQYVTHTNDEEFLRKHRPVLERVISFYSNSISSLGLIQQPAFSDWADNAKREGETFLTNLFLWKALKMGRDYGLFKNFQLTFEDLANSMKRIFIKNNLIYSLMNSPQVTLDSYFFAFSFDFFTNTEISQLYATLTTHNLWNCSEGNAPIPGCVCWPNYDPKDISTASKLAGLQHYSDSIYHSFSIGWAAYVALRGGDVITFKRIVAVMTAVAKRDGLVHEVFHDNASLLIFNGLVFRSEFPFSWGSATLIYALSGAL
ncbi:hypothetical protein RCL1_003812 [Eukaryota sp. TZLM3-RCL]